MDLERYRAILAEIEAKKQEIREEMGQRNFLLITAQTERGESAWLETQYRNGFELLDLIWRSEIAFPLSEDVLLTTPVSTILHFNIDAYSQEPTKILIRLS